MSFTKEDDDEKTSDYIFQKDAKTLSTTVFIAIGLVILIFGVALSGLYFEWF